MTKNPKRPVSGEKTPAQVLVDTGSSPELITPYDGEWYAKVRKMRKDPTLALARQLVTAPVLAAEWSYEEKEDAPEGAKELIEACFEPIRLHLLRNAFNGWLDFGWQAFETIYNYDDLTGKVVIRKYKPLLQDITEILVDPATGGYAGLKQQGSGVKPVILPIPQTLLMSCDVEGTDWYGQAIMRNAEEAYDSWNCIDKAASRYDERVAGSHWVVYYPLGRSPYNGKETDNFEIAKDILASLRSSGRVAIPTNVDAVVEDLNLTAGAGNQGWKIEILSDSGTSQTAFVDRMKYLDSLKVRALGLPERSVLEGQFGTKAESEAHADFAITNMELRHGMAVQDINWHGVNRVLTLNWGRAAANTVFIKPSPIADRTLTFLRTLYQGIIASPDGFALELLNVDLGALKDRLGIPVNETAEAVEDDLDPDLDVGVISAPVQAV